MGNQGVLFILVHLQLPRIQSRGGAEGQMGRSGGAQETWRPIRSTVSGTHTKTAPVQESLWNHLSIASPLIDFIRLVTVGTTPAPLLPLAPPLPVSKTLLIIIICQLTLSSSSSREISLMLLPLPLQGQFFS